MICYNCYSKMIEINLQSKKGKHYHAGVCNKCGNFITGINEKEMWIGEKVC